MLGNFGSGYIPKTYTGTSLSILNTVNAPVEKLTIDGASSQVGTPTPTAPITITNVVNPVLTVRNYASEIEYTATTWAEWSRSNAVVSGDSITLTGYGSISIATNVKASTSYGFLYNVVSINGVNSSFVIGGGGANYPFNAITETSNIGNNKTTGATKSSFITDSMLIAFVTGSITIKDFRMYELPTGSQIETDFTNLTADQLSAKYPYISKPNITKSIANLTATLRNLPNGVKDKLVIDKSTQTAWIERNIGSVVLNGSESFFKYTTTDSAGDTFGFRYDALSQLPIINRTQTNFALCSCLTQKVRNDVSISYSEGFYMGDESYLFYFKIKKTTIPSGTVADLKTWLASNNVTVQYQLATPTTESITYPSLETIQYLTNISKSGLESNISATVIIIGG